MSTCGTGGGSLFGRSAGGAMRRIITNHGAHLLRCYSVGRAKLQRAA
jgi:hypothetical protein